MAPEAIARSALLAKYETFLFDADGVLWTGDIAVPGAVAFIDELLAAGKRVFIITNNSTKTVDQYMEKIAKKGFGAIRKENVINPALVLTTYLRERPEEYKGAEVYLLGTENLRGTLERDGGVKCYGTGPDRFEDNKHSGGLSVSFMNFLFMNLFLGL